ncbi:MAG: hypothetical protein ABSA34_02525 [Candidatus Goldiibacteriota bacterium]|jgi:hypothetical protein
MDGQFSVNKPRLFAFIALISLIFTMAIYAGWGYHNGGYRNDGYRYGGGSRGESAQGTNYRAESEQKQDYSGQGYHNGRVRGYGFRYGGWRGWYGWYGLYDPFWLVDMPYLYFPYYHPYTITYNYSDFSDSYYYSPLLDRYEPVSPLASSTPLVDTAAAAAAAQVDTVAKKTESADNTITINIPNSKGGFTPVTLKKTDGGYTGPNNEFYKGNPTVEELKALYGN